MTDLKTLQKRAEAAAERFEEGRSRLYRKDGEPVYGEAETRNRLAALKQERAAVLAPTTEKANRLMWEASDKLKRAKNADPATLLSEEELARANARRNFANDFAGSANLEDLAARLDSVLATGDKANVFAWWQAGERRRRAVLEARREGSVPGSGAVPKATAVEGMRRFLGARGSTRRRRGSGKRSKRPRGLRRWRAAFRTGRARRPKPGSTGGWRGSGQRGSGVAGT